MDGMLPHTTDLDRYFAALSEHIDPVVAYCRDLAEKNLLEQATDYINKRESLIPDNVKVFSSEEKRQKVIDINYQYRRATPMEELDTDDWNEKSINRMAMYMKEVAAVIGEANTILLFGSGCRSLLMQPEDTRK